MEGFLKTGAEVEVNPDDQYQFLSVYYVITRHLRCRDYHVTFPRVFPTVLGAFNTLSLFTLAYTSNINWYLSTSIMNLSRLI